MKKFLLSSVALLGFTAGAMAADLPRRAPPVFVPVPVFTWTGFYVGVNAGYAWGDSNSNCDFGCGFGGDLIAGGGVPVIPAPGTSFTSGFFGGNDNNRDGFTGGAQVGFNYQFTPGSGFVVGVEADIQWLGGDNNNNNFFGGFNNFGTAVVTVNAPGIGVAPVVLGAPGNVAFFNNGFGNNRNNGNDWFATARVRVGYAFDRTLIYATGGLAFTDDSNNKGFFGGITNGTQVGAPFYVSPAAAVLGGGVGTGGFFGKNNNNDVGWVLGGGVEYAFTNNLTVKLEGLWVNLDGGNNNNNFIAGGVVGVTNQGAPISGGAFGFGNNNNNNNDFFVARVGVNWKFGS